MEPWPSGAGAQGGHRPSTAGEGECCPASEGPNPTETAASHGQGRRGQRARGREAEEGRGPRSKDATQARPGCSNCQARQRGRGGPTSERTKITELRAGQCRQTLASVVGVADVGVGVVE